MVTADGGQGREPQRWSASQQRADMWVDDADDPRQSGPEPTDERGTLLDYLRAYRITLEMKCADLDAEQMATRSVPPSTMSLLGLVRHMAEVERHWFRRVLAGDDAPRLWGPPRADADWNGAVADPGVVTEAWDTWRAAVAFADELMARTEDMSHTVRMGDETVQVRSVLVHMIEEYARHAGHADLLRERIDGRVGQ